MILNHVFENSSMLANAGYNTEEKDLIVTFTNGRVYTYADVEKSTYEELIGAKSAGAYFNSIKKGLVQK